MSEVPTFVATVYVGFKERYDGKLHDISEALAVAQEYVNAVGLCVTVTPTTFVYSNGGEPGCAVGLINYPRFPSEPQAIKAHALELARRLQAALGQMRVSVVLPDDTVMLSVESA